MQIYVLGLALIAMLALLIFIVRRTITMVRERRALLAVGDVEWQAWTPPPVVEEPDILELVELADELGEADLPVLPLFGGELATPAGSAVPGSAALRRRGQLLSAAEQAEPEMRTWPMTPGYFEQVEARLEQAFEALCGEQIDLQRYIALVEQEFEIAQRLKFNLGPLADEALHQEANDVLEALRWCKDWAQQQLSEQAAQSPGS